MDIADLTPLLEQLEDNVEDLEELIQPLFGRVLSETSKKLPVLDKAKLQVLITYTLESLIFSYLRLQGVNAKEHPVFRELTRVRQYFEKIKNLETEPEKRTLTLDKQAAGRFIKHGLAGNNRIDFERAEREAKEKAVAQLKANMVAKRIADSQKTTPASKSRSGSSANSDLESDASEVDEGDNSMALDSRPAEELKESDSAHKSDKMAAKVAARQPKRLSKENRKKVKDERRKKKQEMRKSKAKKS
ncbi:hypothetical protein ASPZODRAFT_136285 [Penicilliopsis zonata CBS 506.65]|uniref:Exosome complex protein n=1 Tax=Penicilliopsis zonata CBS 506.65 TaxID=1073090 RepID=A0A1L9S8E7_9EURO|nr:hypothetical protein ASPZODRAFT_136285 [Penicilliopsis zonata CBS 506.65]OJJ43426.1 hypothetical protein ASPZODRAFT_136285 [Penicilliopsis zonata CBS 506.65]